MAQLRLRVSVHSPAGRRDADGAGAEPGFDAMFEVAEVADDRVLLAGWLLPERGEQLDLEFSDGDRQPLRVRGTVSELIRDARGGAWISFAGDDAVSFRRFVSEGGAPD